MLGIIKVGEYNILICTDSEATVKSLRKDLSKSYPVQNCSNVLNDLAKDIKITIKWVLAHKGIEGNKKADTLAKQGAFSPMIGPEPFTGISIGVINAAKERWIKNRCITYWNGVHKARQARELMLEPR